MPVAGPSKPIDKASPDRIAAVRRFNRFYTRQIGLLRRTYLDTPYSLGEVRVLHEVARPSIEQPTAKDIGTALDLDAGYLSRVLRAFEKRGLIKRTTSKEDARQSHLSLTAQGRKFFIAAEARTNEEVAALLSSLDARAQSELVGAMHTIETLLGTDAEPAPRSYILRDPGPGDFGWIVAEHGRVYTHEYGWDSSFEGLVAGIVSGFVETFDPALERCFIAEMEGEPVGSALLVKDEKPGVARIRLVIVSPKARGLGLGTRLTDECIAFARAKGYRAITLWTHDCLTAARHTYEKAGFTLTSSESKRSFGKTVVSEVWDMGLTAP